MLITYEDIFGEGKGSLKEMNSVLKPGSYGDSGENTVLLQRCLALLSLNYSSVPPVIPAEKVYSESTAVAVRAFQRVTGIRESGTADEETVRSIYRMSRLSLRVRRCCDDVIGMYNKRSIYYYHKHLSSVIFLTGLFHPDSEINTDTKDETENISLFMKYYGLTEIGERLYEKMTDAAYRTVLSLPERFRGYCSRTFPGNIIKKESYGTDTAVLQSCMRYRWYRERKIRFENITGKYNTETESAVKAYQRMSGLAESGRTDLFTWNLIVNS